MRVVKQRVVDLYIGGLGLLIRKSLNIKVSVIIDIMQNCRVAEFSKTV